VTKRWARLESIPQETNRSTEKQKNLGERTQLRESRLKKGPNTNWEPVIAGAEKLETEKKENGARVHQTGEDKRCAVGSRGKKPPESALWSRSRQGRGEEPQNKQGSQKPILPTGGGD